MWWLKTTEIYVQTVVEARILKSRCSRALLLPKALGENLPCLLQLLVAAIIPRLVGYRSSLCVHLVFSSVSSPLLSKLPLPHSYKDTCHWIQELP